MIFALCTTITLFLCSIPTGLVLLTWFYDLNPQQHGSKNIGMSNVWRIKGPVIGLLTLLGDMLKVYLALIIANEMQLSFIHMQLIAIIAVLSHCYSIYLQGKGGKGVATAGGVLLYFAPSLCLGLALLLFSLRRITKKASFASLLTSIIALALCFFLYSDLKFLIGSLVFIIVWRHQENLKRMQNKTELSAQNSSTDPL